MQMTYNYICFFPLIHHQVSIINFSFVLMTLKNGLFLTIFSMLHTNYIVDSFSIPNLLPSFS